MQAKKENLENKLKSLPNILKGKMKMFSTILGRISIMFGLFLVLIVGIFFVTQTVIDKQKDDGLVVNLSGRQRMLTQRMTKETLIYANSLKLDQAESLSAKKDKVLDTVAIFDTTHNALWKGGEAPLTLSMKDTKFRYCPPAGNETIAAQMALVDSLWQPFKKNIEMYLASPSPEVLTKIIADNNVLLKEMHIAVGLMQADAESKVNTIFQVLIAALVLGVIIMLIALKTTSSAVTNPLSKLKDLADKISKGDLGKEVETFKVKEIDNLGQSFNRMRLSMVTMMELDDED